MSRKRVVAVAMAAVLACAPAPTVIRAAVKPAGAAKSSPAPRLRYERYQALLNQYLVIDAPRDSGLVTSFNYERYYDDPQRAVRSFQVRQEFQAVDPGALDPDSRRAWAINFYNFLVIETVSENLLDPGRFRTRWKSVRDIKVRGETFFQRPLVKVDTTAYSLDAFEKHFVFDDFERKSGVTPPASLDPRLHFALVCGALGCPPLQPRAFKGESLDRQLDRAVRDALAGPRHLMWDEKSGVLRVSSIFHWYEAEFGGRPGVFAWLEKYAPKGKLPRVREARTLQRYAQIPWDWNLNQTVGWRYHMMMERGVPGAADSTRR